MAAVRIPHYSVGARGKSAEERGRGRSGKSRTEPEACWRGKRSPRKSNRKGVERKGYEDLVDSNAGPYLASLRDTVYSKRRWGTRAARPRGWREPLVARSRRERRGAPRQASKSPWNDRWINRDRVPSLERSIVRVQSRRDRGQDRPLPVKVRHENRRPRSWLRVRCR